METVEWNLTRLQVQRLDILTQPTLILSALDCGKAK